MTIWRVIALAIVVSGCQLQASSKPCNVRDWTYLINQDRALLANEVLPLMTRVLTPNSVATTDYKPERLNIFVNFTGDVERVSCG